jgi:hypothetical protein
MCNAKGYCLVFVAIAVSFAVVHTATLSIATHVSDVLYGYCAADDC